MPTTLASEEAHQRTACDGSSIHAITLSSACFRLHRILLHERSFEVVLYGKERSRASHAAKRSGRVDAFLLMS